MTKKQKVLDHYGAIMTDEITSYDSLDNSYETIYTADSYDVFMIVPKGGFKYIEPEEHIYYYCENLVDNIVHDIQQGAYIFVCSNIEDELDMSDEDGSFWDDFNIDDDA